MSDLLAEVLVEPEARELVDPRSDRHRAVAGHSRRELVERRLDDVIVRLIEGREESPGPLARTLNEHGYMLPPLPNLFFTRDTAMVLGEHVLIGSMRYDVRWTEELIMKALFPTTRCCRTPASSTTDRSERRINYTLEGGDVHVLRRDT